ncbi:MAG: phenylalanine--tRNA ligase subunit alpha [bacterium]|nr:phenylalanine--tRNA ligase subunit alpha [bacterium]
MKEFPLATIDLSSLHALEIRTLRAYEGQPDAERTDATLPDAAGIGAGQLRRAVEWLLSKHLLEVTRETPLATVSLSDIGAEFVEKGATPESALITAAKEKASTLNDLQEDTRFDKGTWGSAFGGLKKDGVIDIDKGTIVIADTEKAAFYTDRLFSDLFNKLQSGSLSLAEFSEDIQDYIQANARKRGKGNAPFRLDERVERVYKLTDTGRKVLQDVLDANLTGEEISRLTPEVLQSGAWKGASFRRYDLSIKPPRVLIGKHHPYRAYLDGVRRKLLSLGFEEMKGPLVETEFWNMDALFMPQFHAARNIHDAYYITNPTHAKTAEEPFFSRVAESHNHGGDTGSRGWRYEFDPQRSRQLILRSQGTALSARTLAKNPNIPGKYFGIARCFRHDDVDATHSADFFQVEGIVLGEDINFRSLVGLLKLFALEIAQADAVRYVPDYFPFTEPSVELQAKHPTLGWIELGGAGLFRPELTHPLGVDVPVIAWGLGVDRMAMVALGINDIRDLFSTDLDLLRNKR